MTDTHPTSGDAGHDMDRIRHDLTAAAVQLANLSAQTAELSVRLAAQRARHAEQQSRTTAAETRERLQADRRLAALVWARTWSEKWMEHASDDELARIWASARAWAPYDARAARALVVVADRVAAIGIGVGAGIEPTAGIDGDEAEALRRMLAEDVDDAAATSRQVAGEGFPRPIVTALAAGPQPDPDRPAHTPRRAADRSPQHLPTAAGRSTP